MITTVVKSLNESLRQALSNPAVYLIGEDLVDPYGGAFKVTKGLSTLHPDRVLSTPISEGAITGVAAGMAMRGLRPVVEIMFGDFLTLCADQIVNHISKYRWMYNDQVSLPLVIRTPMGGRRGYGPTHSQTLEKLFCGVAGLTIVAMNRLTNPGSLLQQAIDLNEPVIFIENKLLYGQSVHDSQMPILGAKIRHTSSPFPSTTASWTEFEAADVTLVGYGGMADLLIQAGRELLVEDELVCEVVIPTQIKPIDLAPIVDSARASGKLAVFEEGTESWGWGREVVYQVGQTLPSVAAHSVSKGARDLPIGNSKPLEEAILPQIADIKAAVRTLCQGRNAS